MNSDITISIFDLFIFLGVFQGLLLSWFFIKNSNWEQRTNFYQGVLLLFLSMAIFEELLNNTGYIVQFLYLSDFSEPLNFTFGPLVYLYIRTCINEKSKKGEWIHFIIAAFWLLYMVFYWIQPLALKYNSYVQTKHPDWEYLSVNLIYPDDPLGIRSYVNQFIGIHISSYLVLSIWLVRGKFSSLKQNIFKTDNELLVVLRNFLLHFMIITAVFFITKSYFGMRSDIGGYFIATYISFMIFATSYQIMNRSEFFKQNQTFFSFPLVKYKKSSLSQEDKLKIKELIESQFVNEKYFVNNMASLSDLSKKLKLSSHHVSQVINEKMGKSFFELLAWYRVEEAKKILLSEKESEITIEELSERVGYNSKSSFNTVFKKQTSQTPSEFRNSNRKS